MAITFDQSVSDNSTFSLPGGTLTKSLTVGAGASILLVAFYGNNATAPDSVTWDGSAMTQVTGSPVADGGNRFYLYYIISPTSGTHDCVIDAGALCNVQQASYASYFGTDLASPIDADAAGTSSSGTTSAQAITTVTDNAWVVGYSSHAADEVSSAGASTTQRSDDHGAILGRDNAWYDRAATTPGSYAMNVSWATSSAYITIACALKSAAVTPPPPANQGFRRLNKLRPAPFKPGLAR